MALFAKDIESLDDLFVHTLRDIYYAEDQIVNALPDMIDKANDPQLKKGLAEHLEQSRGHIRRLERVFEMHGAEISSVDCPAIDGILDEANEVTGEAAGPDVLDAAIIAAAQAVEHYEITRYGTLATWAEQLGRSDCASLLRQTLDEERAADVKLSQIAESRVNREAA